MEQKKKPGIILFPLPFQGHINPMLQLASILHAKGFSITIIHTQFNSPNPSKYPHFRFYPISDGFSENPALLYDINNVLALTKFLNSNCVNPFRDCLSKLLSSRDMEDQNIFCLITDSTLHFTQAVADGLKVPRIGLWTCNVATLVASVSSLSQSQKDHLSTKESQTENQAPNLPDKSENFNRGNNIHDQKGLYQDVAGIIQETRASSGVIFNSFEDLEQEAIRKCSLEFSVPFFTIGPFNKYVSASSSSLLPQDQSCISWLDKQAQNSVIYVSVGSLAAVTETEFLEIAWGLANSKQPFLWVVRPKSVLGSEWLEPLPEGFLEMVAERGHIVKWAPQQQVLSHPAIGGFWTHCGWNSTLESLCEGVPMICQPYLGDQPINARLISDVWKVGVHLEDKIERGEIEKAIRRLMTEEEGQQMRDRVKLLRDKIDLCLKPGGSSYKSLDNLVTHILSF